MKINAASVISMCCLICAFAAASFSQEPAQAPPAASVAGTTVPRLVSYSGVIKDAAGKPVNGRVPVIFSLYPEQDGGTPLWSETQIVQADAQGHYTVFLGATEPTGLPLDAFTSGAARWLAVQPDVSGAAELPRVLLVGVPYALKAADADTLGGKPASAFVTTEAGASSAAAPSTTSTSSEATSRAGSPTVAPAISGTGTTNFIPLWLSSTTLGNSPLFQMAGNVGIGTMTPDAKLEAISILSAGIGVHGAASGTRGTGVKGAATATTGSTYGVIGADASSNGIGVFGNSTSKTGNTVGVAGAANSPNGFGVSGSGGSQPSFASGNGGTGISGTGGYGGCGNVTCGTGGIGVLGTGGTGPAVGAGGIGVYGQGGGNDTSGSGGAGVVGQGGSAGSSAGFGGTGVSGIGGPCCNGGDGVDGMGSGAAGAGVFAASSGGSFSDGIDATTSGGSGTYAGSFSGDVTVMGNFSVSGTKHFKIDDPLDPANKYLYHASIESSEVVDLYRGNVTLDSNGQAAVQLPAWFEALNKDFSYQLTAVGAPAPGLYIAQEIQNHSFRIAGGLAGIKVSWQVTAVRNDAWEKAHPMVVEVQKPANERGYYLNPELFGAPAEKGVEWSRHPQEMQRIQAMREKQARLPEANKASQ